MDGGLLVALPAGSHKTARLIDLSSDDQYSDTPSLVFLRQNRRTDVIEL